MRLIESIAAIEQFLRQKNITFIQEGGQLNYFWYDSSSKNIFQHLDLPVIISGKKLAYHEPQEKVRKGVHVLRPHRCMVWVRDYSLPSSFS